MQIDHWAKQILFIESHIQNVKVQEEEDDESSSWIEMDNKDEKIEEIRTQHACAHPNCHRSFSKESTLRCHYWLTHRQELSW